MNLAPTDVLHRVLTIKELFLVTQLLILNRKDNTYLGQVILLFLIKHKRIHANGLEFYLPLNFV